MRGAAFLLSLGLVACGAPAPEPAAPGAQETRLELRCADFAGASHDTLVERFGAENVLVETLSAEGEEYQATVVFPDDPARRLEVTWWNAAARASPYLVMATSGQSAWTGPFGLGAGQTIEAVEAANGGPFTLAGFGWDYGGVVLEWNGGSLARESCRVMAYFDPASGADTTAVQGDRPFRSDLPAMRAVEPRIHRFGLSFEAPEDAGGEP